MLLRNLTHIVVEVHSGKFLGYGNRRVREYPDAELLSEGKARRAVKALNMKHREERQKIPGILKEYWKSISEKDYMELTTMEILERDGDKWDE